MITLLLLVRATYIWVLFFAHIPFVVNRTFNATLTERLQQFHEMWKYKRNLQFRKLMTFLLSVLFLEETFANFVAYQQNLQTLLKF